MKKKQNIKGLTFLETITALVIISIVSLFLFVKISKINEKKDLERASKIVQEVFFRYSRKSFYQRENFKMDIFLLEKKIVVKTDKNKEIEKLILPPKLKYEIIYEKTRTKIFKVDTTKDGNLSKAFTIFIFGYSGKVEYRISFYIFQEEKILKINVYLNNNVQHVNYENILEYNYSKENKNLVGWTEEE